VVAEIGDTRWAAEESRSIDDGGWQVPKTIGITMEIEGFDDPIIAHVGFEGFDDPIIALEKLHVFEDPFFLKARLEGYEEKALEIKVNPVR
jgi:hypothetical protein